MPMRRGTERPHRVMARGAPVPRVERLIGPDCPHDVELIGAGWMLGRQLRIEAASLQGFSNCGDLIAAESDLLREGHAA